MLADRSRDSLIVKQLSPLLPELPTIQSKWLTLDYLETLTRFSFRVAHEKIRIIKDVADIELPPKIGDLGKKGSQMILCLGPDEWLIIDNPGAASSYTDTFKALSEACTYSAVDVSHRSVGMHVSGFKCEEALNVGCPLDLSLRAFPVGKCTRTIFADVEIILARLQENQFYLETWRSYSPYVCRYFEKALQTFE